MDIALQIKLLIIFKALVEVAAIALMGRGLVALFAGAKREQNVIYVVFRIITRPAVALAGWITPRRLIRETHLPLVAFFLCAWFWVMLLFAIAYSCGTAGLSITQCTGKSA